MEWRDWEPTYEAILADFGFSRRADEESAKALDALLRSRAAVQERELRALLEGRDVVVAGPVLGPAPLPDGDALIACDAAVEALLARQLHPQLMVTDLDGPVEAQVKANACCSIAVIHAHGDNLAALRRWVPRFQGPVVGTCQSAPVGAVRNYGGFTDGDRAVHLAAHFGAARVVLAGFDFEHPRPKEGRDPAVKARKLAWARRLIGGLGVEVPQEPV